MNINTAVITGRLVSEPEVKNISDTTLCNFRIASNRVVGKKKVEKTIFIDINAWGAQGEVCGKYLRKGSRVAVKGVLCQDTWTNTDGKKNSKIYIESDDVMFLDATETSDAKEEKPSTPPAKTPEAPKTCTPPTTKTEPKAQSNDNEDMPF